MAKICLVTYTREGEIFTERLKEIADAFYKKYGNQFKVVVCCETRFDIRSFPYEVELFESKGTKYRRLIALMESDDSEYYLSVDNDITGNNISMVKLVNEVIEGGYDIGWGRIRAEKMKGLISNLVAVDKLLSHNIIRPFLWKIGCGISVPGQVFCIKTKTYRGKLIDIDTFLDDVALGLYTNVNGLKKSMTRDILGYERPNSSFGGLWNQRSRWAKGYASILMGVKGNRKYKKLVLIHGLSYHASWIVIWMGIFSLACLSWKAPLAAFMILALVVSITDLTEIMFAAIYFVVFPIFHIRWFGVLIGELVKEGKVL